MPETTKIQWCDTTVNPIMGCAGCELFPTPKKVLLGVARAMNDADPEVKATEKSLHRIFKDLVDEVFLREDYIHEGHQQKVTTTNIYHLKERFANRFKRSIVPMSSVRPWTSSLARSPVTRAKNTSTRARTFSTGRVTA